MVGYSFGEKRITWISFKSDKSVIDILNMSLRLKQTIAVGVSVLHVFDAL